MAKVAQPSEKGFGMKAVASKYLLEGEVISWQGKPATVVIIGQGALLVTLALVLTVSLWLGQDLTAWGIALAASLLMILVDRRFGAVLGVISLLVILLDAIGWWDSDGFPWLMLLPLVLSIGYLIVDIVYLGRVLFVITDRRIITRYGIFSLRYAELAIDRIQNVTVMQPWYERLLGYGDVVFATSGEKGGIDYQRPGIKLMSGGAVTWEDVPHPFDVVKRVNEIVHSAERMRTERSAPQPTPDAEARLLQLSELATKGLISQEEYQQKREEVLRRL